MRKRADRLWTARVTSNNNNWSIYKMKLAYKLCFGFLAGTLLIWGTVYNALNIYTMMYKEFSTIKEDIVPATTTIGEMESKVQEIRARTLTYVLLGNVENKNKPAKELLLESMELLDHIVNEYKKHESQIIPEEERITQELESKVRQLAIISSEIIHLKDQEAEINELVNKMEESYEPYCTSLLIQLQEYKAIHLVELVEAEEAVYEAYTLGTNLFLLGAVLNTVSAVVISFALARMIVKPIRALREGSEIIGQGNLDHRVGTDDKDEIGQLSREFDRMAEKLKESQRQLVETERMAAVVRERKRYEQRLQALHTSAYKIVAAKNLEEIIEIVLETLVGILGFQNAGIAYVKGEYIHYIQGLGANLSKEWIIPLDGSIMGRAFKNGETQRISDIRQDQDYLVRAENEAHRQIISKLTVPIIINGEVKLVINVESTELDAFTEEDEKLVETLAHYVSSVISDIRRKEELQLMNMELKRSNLELDNYAYAVSHDLKAPLRSITAFSEFLLEDYLDRIDETGQEYLKRIKAASIRMDGFIKDLLILSRVGKIYTEKEHVNLNTLLDDIIQDFTAQIEGHGAEIHVDELPSITTQKIWIRQLFANLIGNGLKFNKSSRPRVDVGWEDYPDVFMFSVKDNGIGIKEEHQEQIFGLFQRLHTSDEYPGTGAGLAICKKIVEMMGGRIWVESQLESGSKFYFTVPKEKTIDTEVLLHQLDLSSLQTQQETSTNIE